ncbi:NfeD family protein [Streptomyces gobiensis]|uniref:NfeD family protein n=1 Tax=Streptomyces gobiensis TaxID=2875706 RepID=UPI001E519AAF|nr:nodulation protein NfeD [Streptomyces gobiensis]UGY93391.1 nodulation protein NfeD [Streptomyces gobiensis]
MPQGRTSSLVRLLARTLLVTLACLIAAPSTAAAQAPTVLATRVDDTITPVIADHLKEGVRIAERDGHTAFLVEIDTPGGLLTSTREIVQVFLGADIPVIVHVTPSGARAASAGAYIGLSAHILAMASGTHLGAGTPVTGEGEEASEKVVNDAAAFAISIAERRGRSTEFAEDMVREGTAITAQEALRMEVADVRAASRDALLRELNGRRVLLAPGDETTLRTAGARVVDHKLGFFGDLRQLLASPELAFLFLSIGTLAIIYELANPGMGFGGIAGALLLILGFIALSVLPFNIAGLLLLLLAAALFIGEVITPGVGIFATGGTVSLLLAGIFLFRGELGVNPAVLWPTALVVGGGTLLAGRLAWRARRSPPTGGPEALVGLEAVVRRTSGTTGQVFLDGAWWEVRGQDDMPVAEGQNVRVVGLDGLTLVVESAEPPGTRRPTEEDQP